MKVVVLCGGYGTRIRDVADDIPKPMIPIGRLPILWHLMKYYATFGHDEFVLCLGYKGKTVKEFFLNYESHTRDCTVTLGAKGGVEFHTNHEEDGWRISLADTGLDTMTGGRIRAIRQYIGSDDNFMLTYGDGLGDVNLDKLLAFHLSHGKVLTVTGVRPPGRFGEIMANESGIATEFNEKPQATGGLISGGFFVCSSRIFDYIGDDPGVVFEQEPMRTLVREGELAVYEHSDFWQCMDTYRDWQYLNSLCEKGGAPWKIW